jgi:hypothetical protein
LRPFVVSVSVWVIRLKGLAGSAKLTVRLLLTFIVRLPRVSDWLVTIGLWMPQRGSGPNILL